MRYVGGVDEQGNAIEVSDPQLAVIQALWRAVRRGSRVNALLGIEAIFGTELPKDATLLMQVTRAYQALLANGAKATVAQYAAKF
jgi:fructuronate reductase